jgi:hypothetical protein
LRDIGERELGNGERNKGREKRKMSIRRIKEETQNWNCKLSGIGNVVPALN